MGLPMDYDDYMGLPMGLPMIVIMICPCCLTQSNGLSSIASVDAPLLDWIMVLSHFQKIETRQGLYGRLIASLLTPVRTFLSKSSSHEEPMKSIEMNMSKTSVPSNASKLWTCEHVGLWFQ